MPGRNGTAITAIVCHWMDGTIAMADQVFNTPGHQTSATYGVANDVVHQYVKEEDTAYHAGNWGWNLKSIGIEHEGSPDAPITDKTYQTSARLISDIASRYGIPLDRDHIKMHREIIATQCPGTLDIDRLIAMVKNPTAQGGATDMNPRQLVESLYDLLVGARPAEDVLASKAQYVADNGPQQVIKDLIDAGSRYMSQHRALSTYQQARIDAGSRYPDGSVYDANTFADDRLNGGNTFQEVIHGDMAYYLAQDQHLQDLLSKDTPAALSPDDQQDLAFAKTLRSYMKGLK